MSLLVNFGHSSLHFIEVALLFLEHFPKLGVIVIRLLLRCNIYKQYRIKNMLGRMLLETTRQEFILF